MTNTIHAYGELLTASDNERVLTYKLLQFGEPGNTNKGRVTVAKDVLTVPSDISHLTLNTEHKADSPIGRFVNLENADDALYATVSLSDFDRGNEALQAARSGEMTGISVEVRNPVIRAGRLLAGELTGAALCKKPAYPSSMLMAADAGDVEEKLAALQDAINALTEALATDSAPEEEPAAEDPESTGTEEDLPVKDDEEETLHAAAVAPEMKEDTMSEATPAAPAAALFASNVAPEKSALTAFAEALSDAATPGASSALHASISNIANANTFDKTATPDYVGELWQVGRNYNPKFINLLKPETLTSKVIKGWKFDVAPQTHYDYAGFPAEFTSNSPTIVEATGETFQHMGGHQLDRASLALADGGFIESYLRESTDDWARKTDALVLNKIKATSLAVTGVGGTAYHKLLVGAQLINETATPEWVIVGSDLWLEIMETVDATKLSLLGASISFNDGQLAGIPLIPAPLSATDIKSKIIVGNSNALHFYSLPGGPVRTDVTNILNNGEIKGVWGMGGFLVHDARGIITVS
jgi:hypothetical protein